MGSTKRSTASVTPASGFALRGPVPLRFYPLTVCRLEGAGQKSGQYWALDPDTGEVVWVTKAGPGGVLGGLIWGSAVDGERIYVANGNTADGLQFYRSPDNMIQGNEADANLGSHLDQVGVFETRRAPPE